LLCSFLSPLSSCSLFSLPNPGIHDFGGVIWIQGPESRIQDPGSRIQEGGRIDGKEEGGRGGQGAKRRRFGEKGGRKGGKRKREEEETRLLWQQQQQRGGTPGRLLGGDDQIGAVAKAARGRDLALVVPPAHHQDPQAREEREVESEGREGGGERGKRGRQRAREERETESEGREGGGEQGKRGRRRERQRASTREERREEAKGGENLPSRCGGGALQRL
jgi:hypothetical protein